MAGRKPKPASVKRAMGNPGRRPITDMRVPETGGAVKPEFLSRRARASDLWDEYAPALDILGTLKAESAHLFAMWCWLTSSFEEQPDATTASKISNLRALASMLGMDPSAQAKLASAKPADDEPGAEFFGLRAVE